MNLRKSSRSKGDVSLAFAVAMVVLLAAMGTTAVIVQNVRTKELIKQVSELERFYAGELGALSNYIANEPNPSPTLGTADLATYDNSYDPNQVGRQIGNGNGHNRPYDLSETSPKEPGRTRLSRLKKLKKVIKEIGPVRQFCGAATLTEGSLSVNPSETCLAVAACTGGTSTSCYIREPINQLYRSILGRDPNGSEADPQVINVASGTFNLGAVEGALRNLPEYLAKIPTTCSNSLAQNHTYTAAERSAAADYADDVIALYRAFLGRFPTDAEVGQQAAALVGCPTVSSPVAPKSIDAIVATLFALPEFSGANASQFHAEPIREIFLRMLARDPAVASGGFPADLSLLALWFGRLVGKTPPLAATVSLDPPFTYGGTVNPLWPSNPPLGGTIPALLASEIRTNPSPTRLVSGNPVPNGIAELITAPNDDYATNGAGPGEDVANLYRMLINRLPNGGPAPRREILHYSTLLNAPYNAPLTYVAATIKSSAEFGARLADGCVCAAPPPPVCKFSLPKNTINVGESITVTLTAYDNAKITSGYTSLGDPPVGWDGRSSGTITSLFWRTNRTLAPGTITHTATITGVTANTPITETAVVSGPGGASNCSFTVNVVSTLQTCTIRQTRRGPGPWSRWQFGGAGDVQLPQGPYSVGGGSGGFNPHGFYNNWDVFVPGRPDSEFSFSTSFRYGSGYDYTGSAASVLSGNYDPCNRNYNVPQCANPYYLNAVPMPATFIYGGVTYRLMTRISDGTPQTWANGGVCGSADCKCWLTGVVSPIVLDFVGKGVEVKSGVRFDLGEGRGKYFWPKNGQAIAFLAYDRNRNGKIDDIHELFGRATRRIDGELAENGFDALLPLDSFHDGVLDRRDSEFSNLRLWFDRNADGKTDPGELVPLADAGIEYIDLYYRKVNERVDNYGNFIRQRSHAGLATGKQIPALDVWFGRTP